MTVKDKVKESILAWGCAPCGLTWSFGLQMVIIGFFLAGFCSDHWLESSIVVSGYESRNQGLWRFCYKSLGATCCGYINDLMYIEPFVNATRAFLVMSLLPQGGCILAVLTGIFKKSYSFSKFLAAFCIILAGIIYGGASQDEDSTSLYSLSWSYALCFVSGFLYIPFTCFIYCTDDSPDESSSSTT
uniref:Uncharacterized protein n=1 Tax=Magallana gigas TaxID=29159 RepID=K1QCE5_MAGGI|eukprot:XP_011443964.1 PREDICTED: uncharacterized protein LOC105339885 isoform X2 [Crassostrea gigas]